MLSGSDIRDRFLRFFEGKGHTIMPSAPLVPENDPTLLWIVAGMQPFKKYFLGKEVPPNVRLTDCQKCLRTNDIENVGRTARHHTLFEMLGNFSFGDYFKSDIIPWAWEFVTRDLGLDPGSLWVTIHTDDDEAHGLWTEKVGLSAERVVRLEENFWGFGVGPCGPCSEIFVDRGEASGCGSPDCSVECECGRFVEIWNLVFIQYSKDENEKLTPLDKPCIDTGMGLERVASVVQGVATNFDTDLFMPIMQFTAELVGVRYGSGSSTDMALKVIADHARAVAFTVGDGVMPSNEGRGYVIRRILRRSVRFGKVLGIERPFLHEVCGRVIDHFSGAYPSLLKSRDQVLKVVRAEEERFQATLDQGLLLLDTLMASVEATGSRALPGGEVFKLYDTYGFPLEVTQEIAEERGFTVDVEGFALALGEQRVRARAARAEATYADAEMAAYASVAGLQSEFHGYESYETSSSILALLSNGKRVDEVNEGDEVEVVLDSTPFYAESGGQAGDKGVITGAEGMVAVDVTRKPVEGIIVHRGVVSSGKLVAGQTVTARVDRGIRTATARNHSATHLLHKALREVLGEHVHQAGSLVGPERLRFDFSHFSSMTAEELLEVERRVNEKVMENLPIMTEVKSLDEARALGATALFGEKYGASVRVVRMGQYSMELCGGTHLRSTGEAGLFKVLSEGGIAAGVRRIEAATGFGALALVRSTDQLLQGIAVSLKSTRDEIPERLESVMAEAKVLEKELGSLKAELARGRATSMVARAQSVGELRVLIEKVPAMTAEEMRSFGDYLRDSLGSSVIVIASELAADKVSFLAMVSKEATARVQAGSLVKEAARITEGGGGGRPDMAQAGGRNAAKLPEALERVRELVAQALR